MAAPKLTAQIQGQGSVTADNLNTYEQTCDNVAQLRAFVGLPGNQVSIRGIISPNDGGAGEFYWNSAATGPDNGTNTIVPTGAASGAWIRLQNYNATLAFQFPTTTALLAAFANTIILPNGTVAITAGRTAVNDGGGAEFVYVSTDTTSADNGGTIRVDGVGRRWHASIFDEISTAIFGSDPTGTNDSTTAITGALTAASTAGGGIVLLPEGQYKTTSTLTVPNLVYLKGQGRGVSILKPNGIFSQAILATGASFATWGNGIRVGNLEIDGTNFTGNGLFIKWCGLRCYFHDLYIHNCQGTANSDTAGVGMRVYSSFDHTYDRIECRLNASYGVEVYEQQVIPDGVYNELSFLRFWDIQSINNNSAGIQWNQAGGDNCEFWIKPSEGSVGFYVSRNSFNMKIHTLFFDAPTGSPGTGIAAQLNAPFANAYYFENIYGFSNVYNVEVVQGVNTYVGKSFQNTSAGGAADVHVKTTATSPVYLTVPGVSYVDDNTTSIIYPANDSATWSPSLQGSGASLGNGTITAQYSRSGNRVTININFTFGSTTTMPTSGFGFSLPGAFPAKTGNVFMGSATAYHLSTTTNYVINAEVSSAAVIFPYNNGFVNNTTPFTWALNDQLFVTATYEIN